MTDWKKVKKPVSSKRLAPLIAVIGCVVLIVLVLFFIRHNRFTEEAIMVDFSDVATETESRAEITEDTHPVLRVAVAAMMSPEPTRHYYNDLLKLIGDKLGRPSLFLQRRTYEEVNRLLENKEIDVAFVCSCPYVTGRSKFGMELLVAPVVSGEKVYYSYIIVGKNSPITSFEGLRGKKFAYTVPLSNTGKLAPTYMLAMRGEKPEAFFGETFYSGNHDNSIQAVAEGLADGAAVDSLVWETLDATDPTYTARTKIIAKSSPYGIPPVVVHPDLNPELKHKLKDVFLHLHEDKEGQRVLRLLQIDRFEEIEDAMYDSVRNMLKWTFESGEGKK